MARSIELLTALDKLAKTARTQYRYINSGGCCVFAVEVARWLETAGIPVWIVVAARDAEGNLRKIRQYVEDVGNAVEWNDNGVFFHHVGIKFEYKGKTYHYEAEYGVAAENFTLGDDIG
jgi:hypothetical protein